MTRYLIFMYAAVLLLAGCARQAPPPPLVSIPAQPISFLDDVKPVLDSRCVVCHSCYNAACQLKMSSFEGLDRGGSQKAVYSSARLSPQAPTRLFVDAHSTDEWRDKDFHSVTTNPGEDPEDKSIMAYFLDAKRRNPVPEGRYLAEASDLTCAATTQKARTFLGKHPGRGMPFGFPALPQAGYDTLATWLEQGANGPTEGEQAALTTPSAAAAAQIAKWESFLNLDDPKHAMTARYLYEHFFLAHIRFSEIDSTEFFSLVRSTTPPGQPISVIATVRPYD
ncbi:MAG: fatty acid cis/trans isomerase, partial [Gammaproteobacteria bacterium]